MRLMIVVLAAAWAVGVLAQTPSRYVMAMPPRLTAQEGAPQPLAWPEPAPSQLLPPVPSSFPPPMLPSVLPGDPLQRTAYRAVVLREWPRAPQWKLDIYARVLELGTTVNGQARRTTYCLRCAGRTCADGSRVRDGICAASRNIPMGSIIWLESDGLLKVTDRGGLVRVDGGSRSRGENANFDVWRPSCVAGCWTGPGTLARVPWALIPMQTGATEIACRREK